MSFSGRHVPAVLLAFLSFPRSVFSRPLPSFVRRVQPQQPPQISLWALLKSMIAEFIVCGLRGGRYKVGREEAMKLPLALV